MKNIYFSQDYISYKRWESFWFQIKETLETKPKNVLEVGHGSGIVGFVLKNYDINFKSLDIDPNSKSDFIGDVQAIPLKGETFDTVLCFQVLEHLPFSSFEVSLLELRRVSRKFVVISLPEPFTYYFYFVIKFIPFVARRSIFLKTNLFGKNIANRIHKWEIGWPGTSRVQVDDIIKRSGFRILKTFCPENNLYHRFYVLEKI